LQKDLSVVIPLNNEAKTLEYFYLKLKGTLKDLGKAYEIIFVDDGSDDGTFQGLCKIYSLDRDVNILRLKRNYGQAAALAAGIDFARGGIILTMDGDLQHNPSEIPKFLEKIYSGYDVVSGWKRIRSDSILTRRLPSLIVNKIIRMVFKIKIHEVSSSYRAYRRNIIKGIGLYNGMHRFIPLLIKHDTPICEVEISCNKREYGRSHYNLGRVLEIIRDLILIATGKNKQRKDLLKIVYSITEIRINA
jgi:glycosyltransferase involved in cell wall biosynthesis